MPESKRTISISVTKENCERVLGIIDSVMKKNGIKNYASFVVEDNEDD